MPKSDLFRLSHVVSRAPLKWRRRRVSVNIGTVHIRPTQRPPAVQRLTAMVLGLPINLARLVSCRGPSSWERLRGEKKIATTADATAISFYLARFLSVFFFFSFSFLSCISVTSVALLMYLVSYQHEVEIPRLSSLITLSFPSDQFLFLAPVLVITEPFPGQKTTS